MTITLQTRIAYTRHCIRAHLQGFAPMSLDQFMIRVLFCVPLFDR